MYIFFSIALFFSYNLFSDLTPSHDSCIFYIKFEEKRLCSLQKINYLLDYGFSYCGLFQTLKHRWSNNLKKWVEDTTLCLQQKLLDYDNDENFSCKDLEKVAFDSHSDCYKKTHFCKLSFRDKSKIVLQLKSFDLLKKTKYSLKQALIIGTNCFKEKTHLSRCSLI